MSFNIVESVGIGILLFGAYMIVHASRKRQKEEGFSILSYLALATLAGVAFYLKQPIIGYPVLLIIVALLLMDITHKKEEEGTNKPPTIKALVIFLLLVLTLILMVSPTGNPTAAHSNTPAVGEYTPATTGIQEIPTHITDQGILWFAAYSNPSGVQFPTQYSFVASNSITIYSYNLNRTAPVSQSITLSQQINATISHNSTVIITSAYGQLSTSTINLPDQLQAGQLTILWGNSSLTIMHQSIITPTVPFYDSGSLQFFGILALLLGAIFLVNLGIARALIQRTKYFPPIRSHMWIGILAITGVGLYAYFTTYYYDLSNATWLYLLGIYWFISLLAALSLIPGSAADDLYIQFRPCGNNEPETHIYNELSAESKKTTRGAAPEGGYYSGRQWIDKRSYIEWVKRLLGMETPITWGSSETPSATENAAINQLRRKKGPQWEAKQQKNTGTIRAVYLLGPSKQPMAFRKLPRTKRFSLHQTVLETQLHGSHMSLFPYWIANLLTIEQAGILLQELTAQTAVLTARTHAGQYEINQSILDKLDRMTEGENQKEGETNERGQIKPE